MFNFLELQYTKKENTDCPIADSIKNYTNILEAKAGCSKDSTCTMVSNGTYDGIKFWTCRGEAIAVDSSLGSFVWIKKQGE